MAGLQETYETNLKSGIRAEIAGPVYNVLKVITSVMARLLISDAVPVFCASTAPSRRPRSGPRSGEFSTRRALGETTLCVAVLIGPSEDPATIVRIQELGFFGLMASQDHHREHHLAIAGGGSQHGH